MKVIKYKDLASGAKFCVLVGDDVRKATGFGKTKEEAIEKAKIRIGIHVKAVNGKRQIN